MNAQDYRQVYRVCERAGAELRGIASRIHKTDEGAAGKAKESALGFTDGIVQGSGHATGALHKIPDEINGIGGAAVTARGHIGDLNNALTGLPTSISTTIGIHIDGMSELERAYNMAHNMSVNVAGQIAHHDYPGPASAGTPYKIGIPEIFIPNTGGKIIPIGGAGAGAGNITVIVNTGPINNNTDVETMAYRIAQVIKRRSS